MKTLYISDLNVQIWFKKVFILALMPIEFVSVLFQVQTNLSDLCLEAQQKLPSFLEYVKTTYIESEVFPITLWNHFQTEDEKTNNRVEGDNFQMNDCCGAAHPDMAKAVKLLQGYESKAADKYTNASKKEARVASSRLADHDRDRDFRAARKLYHQKRSTLEQYRDDILNIFGFLPKKKYLETVEDTDESDETNDGNDDDDDGDDDDDHENQDDDHVIIDHLNAASAQIHMDVEEELNAFFGEQIPPIIHQQQQQIPQTSTQLIEQLLDQVFLGQTPSTAELEECRWCHVFYKRRGLKTHQNSCSEKKKQNLIPSSL